MISRNIKYEADLSKWYTADTSAVQVIMGAVWSRDQECSGPSYFLPGTLLYIFVPFLWCILMQNVYSYGFWLRSHYLNECFIYKIN